MIKRLVFALVAAGLLTLTVTGCDDNEGLGDQIEEAGDEVEDAVD